MKNLTIYDFWNASVGTWKPIESIPNNFYIFSESYSSQYYTNEEEDTIIRVFDHWGVS